MNIFPYNQSLPKWFTRLALIIALCFFIIMFIGTIVSERYKEKNLIPNNYVLSWIYINKKQYLIEFKGENASCFTKIFQYSRFFPENTLHTDRFSIPVVNIQRYEIVKITNGNLSNCRDIYGKVIDAV